MKLLETLGGSINSPNIADLGISGMAETMSVPFLKWPGGKRWLAGAIAKMLKPRLKGRYYEPFLGGGAVFFALGPHCATLSDVNADLINVYRQVRDQPEKVIACLKKMPVTQNYYDKVREECSKCRTKRAARMLYLNRTAFGGIYRVNREGGFNVPYGGGERTPDLLWRNRLLESSSIILKGISLATADFERVMEKAVSGDVIYCDPTYTVAHENNGFVRYNERNFSWVDQERLAAAATRAYERGAMVVVSNAYHRSVRALYGKFQARRVARKSLVSPKVDARRVVHEYLMVLDPEL